MEFRIADTFTDSLARLTGEEQKLVKTTAFDLQLNPANPGNNFHKLDRAKDKNFWSVRVGGDIRLIVHKTANSLLLCYVDHHDKAYQWAECRKLETHPKTGAAQLVEIRETIQEVLIPVYVDAPKKTAAKKPVLAHFSEEALLGYGVPTEWLKDVRRADEDGLLALANHLPGEAAEALLELATGGKPRQPPLITAAAANPFDHPDAQRRFRVMSNVEELERALEYPWEKWTVFLHPEQRQWVERDYNGPARVSGSAGTGKTIVALHRAVYLARSHTEARVLLATFSDTLANALRTKLKRLISNEPRLAERLEVHALNAIGERLYERHFGRPQIAKRDQIKQQLTDAAKLAALRFSPNFLLSEWEDLVDAWQLDSREAYRDVKRLGRKTRLTEAQRAALWAVFDAVRKQLKAAGLITHASMFTQLAANMAERQHPPFEFVVLDEAQDVSVAQLRFLAALGINRANGLFFAGDLGQRIFQLPFSWKSLGVDIRGRARTLHINYRTSHQIRAQADKLLGPQVSDVDGNVEDRRGTISVFNGPVPSIQTCASQSAESAAVAEWLSARRAEGVAPHEVGVFVRSEAELPRARVALTQAQLPFKVLDEHVETTNGYVSISTMHLAKGLEFRAVVVMACDDDVIPSQARIESVADNADLEEVYNTERHLLYVACTRARDHLLVCGVAPGSEFLGDLG